MAAPVEGTCKDMCPLFEIKLRTRESLLHFFELKNNKPYNVVKEFSRSAAGVRAAKPADLRTPNALYKTVKYLLKEILLDKRKSYAFIYDFIFDRMRCIRQEIVMQGLDDIITITLLEPIIMFLGYSSFRLCLEPIGKFDPSICGQHLQECLKKILCCYDQIYEEGNINIPELTNRCFMEALYQIFNFGAIESLRRGITLPEKIRKHPLVKLSIDTSLEYNRGNYYKAFKGLEKLPHVLHAVGSLHYPKIRRKILHIFSYAYNSKQSNVDVQYVENMLYSNNVDLVTDCNYYNILILDGNFIQFSKSDFDAGKPTIQYKLEQAVYKKFENKNLSEILLLQKL